MAFDLEDFRRLLYAVLQDPARADLLVKAVADAANNGSADLQSAIPAELERAITQATKETRPFGRKLNGPTRIDVLMLSPGGVVLKGRYHGKSLLSDLLNCVVDEGHALGALAFEPFAPHFAAVRDGKKDASWFDFEKGQAGFAAVHPDLSGVPLEKPDCLFAIFVTEDRPEETRRDPAPKVAPIGLAKEMRRVSPAVAKSPRDWMNATPDRRIVRLRDGRAISTRWYGAADAMPVFDFGVIHKSTTADAHFANAAIDSGLGILVIERPGLGASDPAPTVSYEAVAEDVAEIRKALDFPEVLILGMGSAASFALASAHRLGAACKAVALASPRVGRPSAEAPSPYGRVLWALVKNPLGLDVLARLLRQLRIAGSAQSLIQSFSVSNERDKKILHEMGMLAYFAAQTNDAVHKSVEGALAEFRLYQSGARFDPALVSQPIRIWHGAEDATMLHEDITRAFAGAKNVQIESIPGAGTLLDQDDAHAIMRWLAGGWKEQIKGEKQANV
jgi:pimeloyl-ACP methyl ester carboxylesterase